MFAFSQFDRWHEALVVAARSGVVSRVNSTALSALNRSADQLVGKPLTALAPELGLALERMLHASDRHGIRTAIKIDDRPFEVIGYPTADGGDEFVLALIQQKRFAYQAEHSPLAVIEWDDQLRIVDWSPRAELMFGWSLAEVFGKKPKYADVAGLCRAATVKEIEQQGWSLNPGRYVGVAAGDDLSDEDFKGKFEALNEELVILNAQARDLEQSIAANVAEILEA